MPFCMERIAGPTGLKNEESEGALDQITALRWVLLAFYAEVFNLWSFDLSPGLGLPPSF